MKELILKMYAASKNQSLSKIYERDVDANLFEENTDYQKDPTGLFFDLGKNEFYFVNYVTTHNPDYSAHEQQNEVYFMGFCNADTAIQGKLENFIPGFAARKTEEVRYLELDGEERIDAHEQIANLDEDFDTPENVEEWIIGGGNVEMAFRFFKTNDGDVIVTKK